MDTQQTLCIRQHLVLLGVLGGAFRVRVHGVGREQQERELRLLRELPRRLQVHHPQDLLRQLLHALHHRAAQFLSVAPAHPSRPLFPVQWIDPGPNKIFPDKVSSRVKTDLIPEAKDEAKGWIAECVVFGPRHVVKAQDSHEDVDGV